MSSLDTAKNPFKCPTCNVFYCSDITSDNSPAYAHRCNHTACTGCMKKNRKVVEAGSITYSCGVCSVEWQGAGPVKALGLIDILREIDLRTIPSLGNNLLAEIETFASFKCPGCMQAYSSDTVPRMITCGHSLCVTCTNTRKESVTEEEKNRDSRALQYFIRCLKCPKPSDTFIQTPEGKGAPMTEILKWIEAKEVEQQRHQFRCLDCERLTSFDVGYLCSMCSKKEEGEDRVLCGCCVLENHRNHDFKRFLPLKLLLLKDGYLLELHSKREGCKARTEMETLSSHAQNMGALFRTVVDTIPLASKCADGTKIAVELGDKIEEYGEIMEKFIPSARKHAMHLEALIKNLQEAFPQLNVGKSAEGNEEIVDTVERNEIEDTGELGESVDTVERNEKEDTGETGESVDTGEPDDGERPEKRQKLSACGQAEK